MVFANTIKHLMPRLQIKLTNPIIENWVFKLHYRLTAILLVLFLVIVCAKQYVGDHIRCITDKGVTTKVINSYCFSMGTFTIARHFDEEKLQAHLLPHAGVGNQADSDEIIVYKYYQWVPVLLFIQAVCFYMPHYIWKKKEGGRIKMLVEGLQYATICGEEEITVKTGKIPSKKAMDKKLDIIKKDFMLRLSLIRTWSTWLVGMEVMNLLNVVLQIFILDKFLNGSFLSLGPTLIGFKNWGAIVNPLSFIFPKVTKCAFQKYGPSGTIQNRDALCVMALNVTYEKFYAILWFWFLFLFIVSLAVVIWRIASFFLYRQSKLFNELMFQRASAAKLDPSHVSQVVSRCQFGDWLFMYYLAKNMNAIVFQDLFTRVAEDLVNSKHMDDAGYQKIGNEEKFLNIGFDNEIQKIGKKAS